MGGHDVQSVKRVSTCSLTWSWDSRAITPLAEGIPISDRGFRYGQHVFESIAVRNGSALLVPEHLALFKVTALAKGIPLSRPLAAALRKFLLNLPTLALPDGMLRLYLTAGPGAPGTPVRRPACFVSWEAADFPTPAKLMKGIKVHLLERPFLGEGWGEKCGNYEVHIRALKSARDCGADEAIVLDTNGCVLSCAMGNLLVWMPHQSGSVLCTPPSSQGVNKDARVGPRDGAVLQWVRSHTKVKNQKLKSCDLSHALAMAVTNSRLGVMPVAELNGCRLVNSSLALALGQHYLSSHGLLG